MKNIDRTSLKFNSSEVVLNKVGKQFKDKLSPLLKKRQSSLRHKKPSDKFRKSVFENFDRLLKLKDKNDTVKSRATLNRDEIVDEEAMDGRISIDEHLILLYLSNLIILKKKE